jgi:hypothetical protein
VATPGKVLVVSVLDLELSGMKSVTRDTDCWKVTSSPHWSWLTFVLRWSMLYPIGDIVFSGFRAVSELHKFLLVFVSLYSDRNLQRRVL